MHGYVPSQNCLEKHVGETPRAGMHPAWAHSSSLECEPGIASLRVETEEPGELPEETAGAWGMEASCEAQLRARAAFWLGRPLLSSLLQIPLAAETRLGRNFKENGKQTLRASALSFKVSPTSFVPI